MAKYYIKDMCVGYLGYPIGVDVSSSQCLNWISGTILDKFMYWKSQAWSFSTRLKVVQAIMILMISYFLPLLSWTKKSLDHLARSLKYTLWKTGTKLGMSWVSLAEEVLATSRILH